MAAIDILKEKCCGCMLCEELCPSDAIITNYSGKGFYTPKVDRNKCMDCGVCSNHCPIINAASIKKPYIVKQVFLAKNRYIKEQTMATSGGIFFTLASHIIIGDGVVYGAAYTKAWKIKHMRAESLSACRTFQGSKYLQSEMEHIYEQIREDISAGKKVLFTGTPCQIAAVGEYIKYQNLNVEKLILAEILCGGMPSPRLFQEHIAYLEEMKQMQVATYKCRDERNGWSNYNMHIVTFENGDELYNDQLLQTFASFYTDRLNVCESCFSCPYTDLHKYADITIEDSWGIDNFTSAFCNSAGVSQVHINSTKGKAVWNEILPALELIEVSPEKNLPYNSIISYPAPKPAKYEQFWKYYQKNGYERTIKKYTVIRKR